jgi:hypothetical protein
MRRLWIKMFEGPTSHSSGTSFKLKVKQELPPAVPAPAIPVGQSSAAEGGGTCLYLCRAGAPASRLIRAQPQGTKGWERPEQPHGDKGRTCAFVVSKEDWNLIRSKNVHLLEKGEMFLTFQRKKDNIFK